MIYPIIKIHQLLRRLNVVKGNILVGFGPAVSVHPFAARTGLFRLINSQKGSCAHLPGYPPPPPFAHLYITSGFWPRVRARALRAPVFLGS
jgi:hypothetical protein